MGKTYGKPTRFLDDLKGIDDKPIPDSEKITEIKKTLVKATTEDADEIIDVYKDMKNYDDIEQNDAIPKTEKQSFKEKIRDRVVAGEGKIKSQTFDDWFEPK
jgi:hypothetical protein